MALELSGREVAAAMNERIRERVRLLSEAGVCPRLAVVRVGEDPGDLSYEKGIRRQCASVGIDLEVIALPEDASEETLLETIQKLNRDESVHGVLLFRPLPRRMNQDRIANALVPEKDVDGMTDAAMAGICAGKDLGYPPCTAQACLEILDHYGIDCTGKRAVVVGRSPVIGKPAALMLLARHATVTICHTRTVDLPAVTREADLLIAAAGRAKMITKDYVRPGQTVLDVGIHVTDDGRLCGDVDAAEVSPVVSSLTPVPGGVGSVTSAVLADHVVTAAEKKAGLPGA